MPFRDITNEFRNVLQEHENTIPDSKRRKVSKRGKKEDDEKVSVDKSYLTEAYNIV